ncbi:MAG: RluA family pseudouridine synthase [Pirellulaceae bacterium]|nr:RluA family pseudouridine synthase [Pirellulaceae bacterium]
MRPAPLDVLYEDNHLLVVNKRAGLATQGAAKGMPSVVAATKDYLKKKYSKPGNVYLGVVSRLDSLVSGVLVLARTSKAAARLTEQFRMGTAEKAYLALVERPPIPAAGELSHWVINDDERERMIVVPPHTPAAQHARLSYAVLQAAVGRTLVEIHLHTGRKHQIRLQLATIGRPILGDRKYGSRMAFVDEAIALHSARLAIDHPTTRERMVFEAPPPKCWNIAR